MKNLIKSLSIAAIFLSLNINALPNPASVNCIENGGKLIFRNSMGICQWHECNGADCTSSECEEWAFFRNNCKKGECKEWRVEDGASKCIK